MDSLGVSNPITKLLEKFYFTAYYIDDYMKDTNDLGDNVKLFESFDAFHSQFQLQIGTYRDNNNFFK